MKVNFPTNALPVVILRSDRRVAEEAALRGLHIGYWRHPATGQDYLLTEIARETDAERRRRRITEWYSILRKESLECGKLPAVWHDGLTASDFQHLGVPVYEIRADSADGVFASLPDLWRRFLQRDVRPVKVFYHVACMGNWKEVAFEQLGLIYETGLPFAVGVVGPDSDRAHLRRLRVPIEFEGDDLGLYEIPTLALAWIWAKQNPTGGVFYVHTKGVSQPFSAGKRAWRRIMEIAILEKWKNRVVDLGFFDAVGVSWCPGGMPHFRGNFWAARCDWIAQLQDPRDYQAWNGPTIWGNPWKRMAAEMWIGSRPGIVVKSLVGTSLPLLNDEYAVRLLEEVTKNEFAFCV